MKIKTALLSAFLLVPRLLHAEPGFEAGAELHAVPMMYFKSTARDTSALAGTYLTLGYKAKHLLEVNADTAWYRFQNDVTTVTQQDLTLAYTNSSLDWVQLRLGGHYIISGDTDTDGGRILFGSIMVYQPYFWNVRVGGSYSDYPAFKSMGLVAGQVSPRLGYTFGESGFYSELAGHYIRLNNSLPFGKQDFYSVEELLSYFRGGWVFSLGGWQGEQAYAVHAGGMAVYNTPEKYTGGANASVAYLWPSTAIRLGFEGARFDETYTVTTTTRVPRGGRLPPLVKVTTSDMMNTAYSVKAVLSIGHTF